MATLICALSGSAERGQRAYWSQLALRLATDGERPRAAERRPRPIELGSRKHEPGEQ